MQILSFNDFHGHLDPESGVGGAAALAGKVEELRAAEGDRTSITVAAGDLIGGSPLTSGLFQDEPAIQVLEALGLDTSAVGNHEFDEGVDELLRIQNGGCHPVDGCYGGTTYDGADFPYLAANVVWKDTGEPILPPTYVENIKDGKGKPVRVGFIGVVTSALPTLVSPGGIADVDVLDEADTINYYAGKLQKRGVETIVVLMHEGGFQTSTDPNACANLSGPVLDINAEVTEAVDLMVTGHSHVGYICQLADPAGNMRYVTQAQNYGNLVTETHLLIDKKTGDVVRAKSTAVNHRVPTTGPQSAAVQVIVDFWNALADPLGAQVIGTISEDIPGSSSNPGCRCEEMPGYDMVADAILWGTQGAGAQIAFMNAGGVRSQLMLGDITNGEAAGEVTYEEAFDVAPFGNILVTLDMTGAQIDTVLEQQYQPILRPGARVTQFLAPSEGFTYTWDTTQPQGSRASNLMLNGVPINPATTYKVGTLSFLAEGGDLFTGFRDATNLVGAGDDLENLVAYIKANPGLDAPEDRVTGL